jgi:lactose/L-arabinose transport system permease protein
VSKVTPDLAVDRAQLDTASGPERKPKQSAMARRRSLTGWAFIAPAAVLIFAMNFWPMIQAFILSFKTGRGNKLSLADPIWYNYARLLHDDIFKQTMLTTLLYLIIQVPIMLGLAMVLANMLNSPTLRFRGVWRTAIFLPVATSLVSYAIVFRTMFGTDGFVNDLLVKLHIIDDPVNWLGQTNTARIVIVLGLLWRWTGFNMILYLAALQNIEPGTQEAAKLDGAGAIRTFWSVTMPQMRPIILLTVIISTNGTIQLFDESYNLTGGGPAYTSMTMSHYLYEVSFHRNPNFGYGAAMSYVILLLVAIFAAVQVRLGDKRD